MTPAYRQIHLNRAKRRRIADKKPAVVVYPIAALREACKPDGTKPIYSDKPSDLLLPAHWEHMH